MGAEKALLALAGRSVVGHVVERLRPQVAELYVNANGDAARFASFHCAVIPDATRAGLAGPLVGVAAALAFAARRGFTRLATAPCDAPFLPLDLVARLDEAMSAHRALVAVAQSPHGLEPMFALWSARAQSAIADEFACGEASPRNVIERLGAARVLFSADGDGDPFANLNRPEDLAAARARFGRNGVSDDRA